mmetsp:Transcript_55943/g.99636  ORF Transcript_55943/g.99636 Transcript_55943/m.99636 type:complete len:94 (+) Transcript_55943:327-608(+)
MCDELGPKEGYMKEFVEEFVMLCDVNSSDKGCSEQQVKFIKKWSDKDADALKKELSRLQGMQSKDGASMKPEAAKWVKQRLALVKQLQQKTEL